MSKIIFILLAISLSPLMATNATISRNADTVQKTAKLVFQPHASLHALNEQDAVKLRKILAHHFQLLNCDSVTFRVMVQVDSSKVINIIDILKTSGYVVANFTCNGQEIIFKLNKEINKPIIIEDISSKDNMAINNAQENLPAHCAKCGTVRISDNIINQFKNADYQGIDLAIDLTINTANNTPAPSSEMKKYLLEKVKIKQVPKQ